MVAGLEKNASDHSTRFRDNGCFSVPKVKVFGKKSFAYHGCTLWNDPPVDLNNIVGLAP